MASGVYKRTKPSWNKGIPHSKEQREKISRALKGHSFTEETLKKMSLVKLGHKSTPTGEKHPNWKGDDVSYRSLHQWIQRQRGKPSYCEHCKRSDLSHRQYHWANKSHQYKRDVTDWVRLCVKCHKKYDNPTSS